MQTFQWAKVRLGDGKYGVRLKSDGRDIVGCRLPGIALGGNGKWVVQVGGKQLPDKFSTLNSALVFLVRRYKETVG